MTSGDRFFDLLGSEDVDTSDGSLSSTMLTGLSGRVGNDLREEMVNKVIQLIGIPCKVGP